MTRQQFLLKCQSHPRSRVSNVRLDVGHRLDVTNVEDQRVWQRSQMFWAYSLPLAGRFVPVRASCRRNVCLQL